MVKAVAVTPSTSAHEMVRELVDDEADAVSPSNENKSRIFTLHTASPFYQLTAPHPSLSSGGMD